jgi:hypothetical protein
VFLVSCIGPPAPDGPLCRDLITRLCQAPRCGVVDTQLAPGDECDAKLTLATGCGAEDFEFTTPTRNRVLECRIPLLRQGDPTSTHPACVDVDELFTTCPDVVRFLGGTP